MGKKSTNKKEMISETNRLFESKAGAELLGEEVYVFPTTFAQKQLWFLFEMDRKSAAYSIPLAFRMKGKLNPSAFKSSVNEILRRHETFRTSFGLLDGEPMQIIAPELQIPMPVIDLTGLSEEIKKQEVEKSISSLIGKTFDLTKLPLIQMGLLELGDEENIFLLNMHHIILDHLSITQFSRELTVLYDAFKNKEPSPLQDPLLQFPDYAVWQNKYFMGEPLEVKVPYWKETLTGRSNFLGLPTDRPRPKVQRLKGTEQFLHFSPGLTKKLVQFSRGEGVTLFIALLSAFKVLLHRYTGQMDLTVGCPFANRNESEVDEVMGCFINTLPMPTDFSGDPSFREILSRVRKGLLGAYGHQEVPFKRIVEEIRPARDMGYNPMFQVTFTFQESPMSLHLSDLEVSSLGIHNGTSKFDMFAWLWESQDGVRGLIEYNNDLFDKSTMERFVGHFQKLVESSIENPDLPVKLLPILLEHEKKQMMEEWNATQTHFSKSEGIHFLFSSKVEENLDRIAVTSGDSSMTYGELDRKSNQLARHLRSLGVGPEILVGISTERSLEMMVGLLGILKAGGAYLPLDPQFPQERLAFMLEDADVSYLVTESDLVSQLPERNTQDILLDDHLSQIEKENGEPLENLTKLESLAYVIYTSGSTGRPKGVQVPHGTVINFLKSMAKKPGLKKEDVLLAVTTLSFDIAVLELLLPLTVGAQVDIVSKDVASDGNRLLERLQSLRATVMQATPATWSLLLAAGWKGSEHFKILCGGEALPKILASDLLTKCGDLWNMYGPTETTVWSSCFQVLDGNAPIFIGKPISNTAIYLLDDCMQPVPIGVPGELYIGGAGVSRGYLNRPELTAERFLANPFVDDSRARIYKTGDLARYHPDGNIEYINRLDDQVKVRGFRIELAEIEAVLERHETVAQCVVTVHEERVGDKRLVAYVVYHAGLVATSSEFRNYLRSSLPEYMIPVFYIELEAIPLTPNGKVNRLAMPSPFKGGNTSDNDFVLPITPIEQQIAEIWKELLGVEQVGRFDNFFDLGGHSLLSMQAIVKVKKKTGQQIIPRNMIMDSLAQIAEDLDPRSLSETAAPAVFSSQNRGMNETLLKEEEGEKGLFSRIKKGLFR